MSYDITLMPRSPDQDWDEALEASNDVEVQDRAALLEIWGRINARLRALLPGQVESHTQGPGSTDSLIGELAVVDNGIEVMLFAGQASVSFPFWEQGDPESFHHQVAEAVRIVAEETGYAAYDQQTDAEFDGTFDDEPGIAFTRHLRDEGAAHDADPGAARTGHVRPSAEVEGYLQRISAQPPRPFYSGRRRAGTYLVIGAIVTAVALWQIASTDAGPVWWVALAIGVADLAVGAVGWFRAAGSAPGRAA